MKSYVKLSSGLMLSGLGAVALERALASGMASSGMHLPNGTGWVLTALALAPLALIAAGVLVYLGGAVLGLK
ncbi:hypothetical protein [Pelagibacterium mangrovi]|uniref:hypothetical protein n=1 Tax=Pelagibacterium mangrovi TaxID=3119828 RepID=UPI002FC94E4D